MRKWLLFHDLFKIEYPGNEAGTRLANALRKRPFSACKKGNRRRLHVGEQKRRRGITTLRIEILRFLIQQKRYRLEKAVLGTGI